jgi:hypothetical protein
MQHYDGYIYLLLAHFQYVYDALDFGVIAIQFNEVQQVQQSSRKFKKVQRVDVFKSSPINFRAGIYIAGAMQNITS